ncbi:hypothetical protein J2X20_000376 [Pelomonas saccharophila]|uniref:TIGR04222 domain-containing membrane protein n=1 Tax=Roseateles saccharophilus TaxID=304 RepID=A0ABU1YFW7_ROSSA|nr:hypothetical protein [Roseateles saccharophilus]MDR7267747.1 hypothetical protein [Roseateles saccharophilus]
MNQLPKPGWWQRVSRSLPWHSTPQRQIANAWRRLQRQCPPAALAAQQIAPQVRAAWQAEVAKTLPGFAVQAASWPYCATGLAQFFEASRLQRDAGPCALPSRAADSVWHAWLKVDPGGLAAWQQRFFGRVIEHRESADLGAPVDECLARTWAAACRSEGRSALAPRLPLVFALDAQLRPPTGWAYTFERGRLVHRQIDGFGETRGMGMQHAALAGTGLAALGLLSAGEAETMRRRAAAAASGSTGGDGSFFGWGGFDSGSGSGDCSSSSSSDGGGGCSCGSSCGGGS